MKRVKSKLLLVTVICVISVLTGCPNGTDIEKGEFEVRFEANGGTGTMDAISITEETERNLPENEFTRAGYSFAGWSLQAEGGDIAYEDLERIVMGETHVTLYAQWTPKNYTVTFNSQGGSAPDPATKEVTFDDEYGDLPEVDWEGFELTGWFTEETSGTKITSTSIVKTASGHTLFAQWDHIQYAILYHLDGGTNDPENPSSYTVNDEKIELGDPSRTGYTFEGWFNNAEFAGDKVTEIAQGSTGEVELYAKWSAKTFNVSFDSQGGSTPKPENKEVTFAEEYSELPTVTLEGYTFTGWFTAASDGTKVEASTEVTTASNHTLFAQWEIIDYDITYYLDGGTNDAANPASYTIEDEKIELGDPSRTGYTFEGWYDNDEFTGDAVTEIAEGSTGEVDLHAKWELIEYDITYHLDGGNNDGANPQSYNIEDEKIMLEDPTKRNHTFLGWYDEEDEGAEVSEIPAGSYGNLELFARWEFTPTEYDIGLSPVLSFNANGGVGAMNYVSYEEGVTFNLPANTFSREGYTFKEWNKDEDGTGASYGDLGLFTMGDDDKTLYAQWNAISFSITYNLDGGTNHNDNPETYTVEDTITLKDPDKDKHSFEGWYNNAEFEGSPVTVIGEGSTGEVELYAKWEKINDEFEVET